MSVKNRQELRERLSSFTGNQEKESGRNERALSPLVREYIKAREKARPEAVNIESRKGFFSEWEKGREIFNRDLEGGGELKYYVSDDREPEFELLDIFLDEVAPDISYRDYRRLRESVIRGEWSGTEGHDRDSVDYKYKVLPYEAVVEIVAEALGLPVEIRPARGGGRQAGP